MKKLLIALFGAALILGACGGGDDAEPETPDAPAQEASGDFDASRAQTSYQTCAGCHGGNLEGGTAASLKGLSKEEVLSAIQEGRQSDNGVMPANMVSGDDAENLAAWIAAQ